MASLSSNSSGIPFFKHIDYKLKRRINHSYIKEIKNLLPNINYFFGYIYDSLMNNYVISSLLGNSIPRPQTIEYVSHSHALATHLAYNLLGKDYLKGMSTDSTYILNIYTAFGFFGLFFINLFLGIYLCRFAAILAKCNLLAVIVLYSYLNIFMIPRADIMISFSFLVTPYFWFSILVIYTLSKLLEL